MNKRMVCLLAGLILALTIHASASDTNSGWVMLYYGAGDAYGEYWGGIPHNDIDSAVDDMATVGSGLYNGHYFTILAVADTVDMEYMDGATTKCYWVFKSGTAGDLDSIPNYTNGRVDLDQVCWYDDNGDGQFTPYVDEVFIDSNQWGVPDGIYTPQYDVCVWAGGAPGVQCPSGYNFKTSNHIKDLVPGLGPTFDINEYPSGTYELNMADPSKLQAFINNARTTFGDYWKYSMLFEKDHGQFMIGSVDYYDGYTVDMCNTMNVIQEDDIIHADSAKQVDVVFYDQCLRAGMDPLYELVDETYGNGPYYAVASEAVTYEEGLHYAPVATYLKQNPSADPEDAASEMVHKAKNESNDRFDTVGAFCLNRVSAYGTGEDIHDVADDIEYMAQRLVQFEYLDHKYIRNALEDAVLWSVPGPGPLDSFYGFDLKRFINEYLQHCNQTNTELIARLQTVSNDLVEGTNNYMIHFHGIPNDYGYYGVSTYMPIYWTRVYQTPEQDPLNGALRNNGQAGAERPPVNPVTYARQTPGYRCWVDPNWYYEGGTLTPPPTQPMFYYKNTPGTGQTAVQLADYAKHSANWCQFIASDITPLHVWSTNPFYPANQATDVSIYTHPVATFAEAIDTNYGRVWLIDEATNELTEVTAYVTRRNVTKSDGYVHGEFEFSPPGPFKCNNPYCVLVGYDYRDTSGNQHDLNGDNFAYGEYNEWHFTTGAW